MNEEKTLTNLAADQLKKAYSKPSVKEIHLVAEEAVLALCKLGTGIGARASCMPDRTCLSMPRS